MCFGFSSKSIIYLPIVFITAIAPEDEVPRAARNVSTEHTSLVDGSNTVRKKQDIHWYCTTGYTSLGSLLQFSL